MFSASTDPFLVPFDGSFQVSKAPTRPPGDSPGKARGTLREQVAEMRELQRMLYAQDRWSLLLVFQGIDAAGKDGTIRAVMTGINPAGCQVFSFKQPSAEELDHDFLWRTSVRLPERGRIGIFNRSYYEEVLVVRVHPEFLDNQQLPHRPETLEELWKERYHSIREHERHLARNGTVVLKFFLNLSKDEQRRRFLRRLRDPERNWKFAMSDVRERSHWERYMEAFQEAVNATSTPWAPWYAIPADDKGFMRLQVSRIIVEAMRGLGLRYPTVGPERLEAFREIEAALKAEG